jgi:hypothetical protein
MRRTTAIALAVIAASLGACAPTLQYVGGNNYAPMAGRDNNVPAHQAPCSERCKPHATGYTKTERAGLNHLVNETSTPGAKQ